MRNNSVLRSLLGLCVATVVIVGLELVEASDGGRSKLVVWVRRRARGRGRCGRCGLVAVASHRCRGVRRELGQCAQDLLVPQSPLCEIRDERAVEVERCKMLSWPSLQSKGCSQLC